MKKTAKKKTKKRTRPNRDTKSEVFGGKCHVSKKNHDSHTRGVSVSVCLIVKNEEEFLDNCLVSINGIADEIIVVDTGSEDRTVEIAQRYTDKIYFHPWNDSFSEARNHYLNYATGDWIFQIDADEELLQEDIPALMEVLQDGSIDAIMVQIISRFRNGSGEAIHSVERIFRNNSAIHYEGRVHNRLVGITSAKVCPIRFNHYGYDLDQIQSEKKFQRTVRLLKLDLEDDPHNPITYHYLSCSYFSKALFEEALETSLTAINLAEEMNDHNMIYLWSRYNAAMAYCHLKRFAEAEKMALSSINRFSKHIDAYFVLALVYYEKKDWKHLIRHAQKYLQLNNLLKTSPEAFGNLVTCSLNEAWNIHVLVGIAYSELGQENESNNAFEKGVKSAPTPFAALRAAGVYFHRRNSREKARKYLLRARADKGDDPTVNQLLEELGTFDTSEESTQTISCCMIVKDEEKYLTQCLESVKDHVDEIIIVDTGSTDRTVEIAQKYTDTIYFHPWNDNFSEARNQALSYATSDWIFIIDADEELVEENQTALKQALDDDSVDAIMVQIISKFRDGRSEALHNSERLFRNNGVIHYEGRIHNRVVGFTNAKVCPLRINHYGYDLNQRQSREKFERTVHLLKLDLEDTTHNPVTYHYLSCSYLSQEMFEEALEASLTAVDLAEKQNNRSMLYLWSRYNAAMAYYRLKRFDKAEAMALSSIEIFPKHIDAYFTLIMVYFEKKDWKRLIVSGQEYLDLAHQLKTSPETFGNLVTCSLNEEWNIHVLIGIAYFELGRSQASAEAFEKSAVSAPTPFVALRAAGIYLHRKNENEKARRYLIRALAERADDPTVNSLLETLGETDRESTTTQTISCCMIVKDEEAFLTQCLESVKDHVDEIVIVDTGSTDGTVEIAQKYTGKIYFHPWEGSFSKARNQALAYATCDWVFQIDADEKLVEGSGPKLRQAAQAAGEADAIHVNIISTYNNGTREARHNFERLFKNNGIIHYEGIVHNRVVGAACIKTSKIELMHYGYDVEEKKSCEKFIRTTELLKTQIEENPNDPMPHHYLGTSYLSRSMYEDCARESVLAIDLAHRHNNTHPLYLWSHYNAAISFLRMGNSERARMYALQALEIFADHLDSFFILILAAAEENAWQDLLRYGNRYLQLLDFYTENPDRAGLVINATLKEAPTVHILMGHALHAQGDLSGMDRHYKRGYELADTKWDILWNIGTFHLDQSGDLTYARKFLNLALDESPSETQVWYMLAKLNNKTESHDEERRCLEELFKLGGTDTMTLNRLASLYIDVGCNRQAIEVLNHILDNDRMDYRALCSLGRILKDEGKFEQAVEKFETAAELNPQGLEPWIHMGNISMELNRYEEGRVFFERALALSPRRVTALLSLCEIDLRQNRIVDFIQRCDLILSELELDRNRTIHAMEDLVGILLDIKFALRKDPDATGKLEALLSLIPVDYASVLQSLSTLTWQDTDTDKKDFFLKTVSDISRAGIPAS